MKIKVLYEDSNILAIDKPSGISVHSDGRTKEKTIADWALENYPRMKNVGEPMFLETKSEKIEIKRPGIVHRLDRDTSGVLLLAKNQKAYEYLKSQFQDRVIKKTYHVIVEGTFKDERGVINKPIGKSPTDFRKWLSGRGARGELRPAITQYKVLKRFELPEKKTFIKYTYLEVYPKTGRTHQIRVHMKYLNHPVVCDPLYNAGKVCPLGITRLALHAKQIEFRDMKGNMVRVESVLPLMFKKVLK
mgnify:CR=1 FL=1